MTHAQVIDILSGNVPIIAMFGILLIKMMRLEHKLDMHIKDFNQFVKDCDRRLTKQDQGLHSEN